LNEIEYTQDSLDELDELIAHIYQDSPSRAKSYLTRIEKAISNLSIFPNVGVMCGKKQIDVDCRILIVDNYLIFYRYLQDKSLVKVLHIVYGNIQYQKLFT